MAAAGKGEKGLASKGSEHASWIAKDKRGLSYLRFLFEKFYTKDEAGKEGRLHWVNMAKTLQDEFLVPLEAKVADVKQYLKTLSVQVNRLIKLLLYLYILWLPFFQKEISLAESLGAPQDEEAESRALAIKISLKSSRRPATIIRFKLSFLSFKLSFLFLSLFISPSDADSYTSSSPSTCPHLLIITSSNHRHHSYHDCSFILFTIHHLRSDNLFFLWCLFFCITEPSSTPNRSISEATRAADSPAIVLASSDDESEYLTSRPTKKASASSSDSSILEVVRIFILSRLFFILLLFLSLSTT